MPSAFIVRCAWGEKELCTFKFGLVIEHFHAVCSSGTSKPMIVLNLYKSFPLDVVHLEAVVPTDLNGEKATLECFLYWNVPIWDFCRWQVFSRPSRRHWAAFSSKQAHIYWTIGEGIPMTNLSFFENNKNVQDACRASRIGCLYSCCNSVAAPEPAKKCRRLSPHDCRFCWWTWMQPVWQLTLLKRCKRT